MTTDKICPMHGLAETFTVDFDYVSEEACTCTVLRRPRETFESSPLAFPYSRYQDASVSERVFLPASNFAFVQFADTMALYHRGDIIATGPRDALMKVMLKKVGAEEFNNPTTRSVSVPAHSLRELQELLS